MSPSPSETTIDAVSAAPGLAEQLLVGVAIAFAAAILTVLGNWLIQHLQARGRVRAELREFVRSMHAETISTVADLDLLIRELRASALTGWERPGAPASEVTATRWEGDLLKRVRVLRFGHPDPDVRAAAEVVEDCMWTFVTWADERGNEGLSQEPHAREKRASAVDEMHAAMTHLRAAAWRAPRRDVPAGEYEGDDIPSRVYRTMLKAEQRRTAD